MYYTYVLESIRNPGTRYTGHTSNLTRRLKLHNALTGPAAKNGVVGPSWGPVSG